MSSYDHVHHLQAEGERASCDSDRLLKQNLVVMVVAPDLARLAHLLPRREGARLVSRCLPVPRLAIAVERPTADIGLRSPILMSLQGLHTAPVVTPQACYLCILLH